MTDQEKREQVIKGLEWLLENMNDTLNDFVFLDYDGPAVLANKPIIEDALDLLKVQEPHVMTLDEVSEESVAYLETRQFGTVDPALSSGSYNDGTVGLLPWTNRCCSTCSKPTTMSTIAAGHPDRPTHRGRRHRGEVRQAENDE